MRVAPETLRHIQRIRLDCGCISHPNGLILDICDRDVKKIDQDRIISLMLKANAKIAEVIDRIERADMIGMDPFLPPQPLGRIEQLFLQHPGNFDLT